MHFSPLIDRLNLHSFANEGGKKKNILKSFLLTQRCDFHLRQIPDSNSGRGWPGVVGLLGCTFRVAGGGEEICFMQ